MTDQSAVSGVPQIVALNNLELAFSKAMCDVLQNMVVQQNTETQLTQAALTDALSDLGKSFDAATVAKVESVLSGASPNTSGAVGADATPAGSSPLDASDTAMQGQLAELHGLLSQAANNDPAMTGIQYLGYAALIYSALTAFACSMAAKLVSSQEQVRFAQVATVRAIQKMSGLPAPDAAAQIEGILTSYQKLGLGSAASTSLIQGQATQFLNLFASFKAAATS